jgi:hypothetical protein
VGGAWLRVTIPNVPTVLRGYYMLFAVNPANGVPSTAKWLKLY